MSAQTPPTPWTIKAVNEEYSSAWLGDADGATVAHVFGDDPEHARATAELILAAVNGREQMRWTLAQIASSETNEAEAYDVWRDCRDDARAALQTGRS